MSRPRRVLLWQILTLGLTIGSAVTTGLVAYRMSSAGLAEALDNSLILTRRAVEAEIERFRYLPRLMLDDPRIRAVIAAPDVPANARIANRALELAARRSGAAQLYLLDASGTTIATSNWQDEASLMGHNYAFRPYFKDAMARDFGHFYAIGATTGIPGYFIASAVTLPDGQRAVMALKVDLIPLQDAWRDAGAVTALADAFGIVFLASNPDWVFRPLRPLSDTARMELDGSRAYADRGASTARPLLGAENATGRETIRSGDGDTLLLRRLDIESEDWTLVSAAPLGPSAAVGLTAATVTALLTMTVGAIGQALVQRRRMVRLRLRQSAVLEERVAARTSELAHEIEVRRRAETGLRAAQDALVHSEKMAALGRMSAAIVHEISQPLAAMEASLAAVAISGKVTDERSGTRIEAARGHIRRMLRTIKHLKSFCRKDSSDLRPVSVDAAIANAVDLVAPRSLGLTLRVEHVPEAEAPAITGGQVRLEQVLVNLLLNAIDAVTGLGAPEITVQRTVGDGQIRVTVSDNGPGIPEPLVARVTEPFFSTKTSGEGLGLGLSICKTIVEEFGGRLEIASDAGGTCVTVVFPVPEVVGVAAQ